MQETDVIIIGAGVAGLSLAADLSKRKIPFVIFERANELEQYGGGLKLWPNAIRAFSFSGLSSQIIETGTVIHSGTVYTDGGKILSTVDLARISKETGIPTVSLRRSDLLDVLKRSIPKNTIHFNFRLNDWKEDSGGITAFFENGRSIRGKLLISAEGLDSIVEARLHPHETLHFTDRISFRGIVNGNDPELQFPYGESHEFFGAGKRFGYAHMGPGIVGWYAPINNPIDFQPKNTREYLLEQFKKWPDPIQAIIKQTDPKQIIRSPIRFRHFMANSGKGRIALIGDAAHAMTPDLAQGACMGIEDAAVLGKTLSEKGVSQESLRLYESRRLQRVRHVSEKSRNIGRFSNQSSPVLVFLRNLLWQLTPAKMAVDQIREIVHHDFMSGNLSVE